MERSGKITVAATALSIIGLFLEQARPTFWMGVVLHIVDTGILSLLLWETAEEWRSSTFRMKYLSEHWPALAFLGVFTVLFLYSKYLALFAASGLSLGGLPTLLRNVFLALKIGTRLRKAFRLVERLASHPAQTVVVSFMLVILVGALVLMMPLSDVGGRGISFIDALFTSTSAVCVTGLVVVDTATAYTPAGWMTILILIQIGGLGIMVFAFFTMFATRKKLSLKDQMTMSYMLSEDDMTGLYASLKSILFSTLAIEGFGALLLFVSFLPRMEPATAAFYAAFHSVSAFCNAGFALYSDSLESFRTDVPVMLCIALLIILGGISFGVIKDVKAYCLSRFAWFFRRRSSPFRIRSVNTKVVLTVSGLLIVGGWAGFYVLEHRGVMADYGLGEQYLAAFFQSVTLRTAGFNSVPFGALAEGTLLFMILFMFIGGASGSTAGGIKINTVAAMAAYFNAFLRQEEAARIGSSTIAAEKVGRAFLILLFGLAAVFAGTFVLTLTEKVPFIRLLFEAVSAFGTVGLSAGVTPGLSVTGKVVIIVLMFLGRLGPLAILTAASRARPRGRVEYPLGDLAIG